ncbi:TetR/AcrR family transcriptional regulator [Cyclonatronum proteinivorum]|nr:TetR/AcrR family transcriptional regulator [Cyclonatronum proteinivorum]
METTDAFEQKLFIATAAVQAWEVKGRQPGLFDIAAAAGVPASDLYKYFPNVPAVFHFWYESLPQRYRLMVAELDAYNELTLSEKLTNMMLTITDMMEEQLPFVQETFNSMVFKNQSWHPFCKENEHLLKEIISTHQGLSRTAQIVLWDDVYAFLSKEFLHVIKFWMRDTSPDRQKTMALLDTFNGLVSELMTNRLIDKGTDLARFFWNEGLIKIPFVSPK